MIDYLSYWFDVLILTFSNVYLFAFKAIKLLNCFHTTTVILLPPVFSFVTLIFHNFLYIIPYYFFHSMNMGKFVQYMKKPATPKSDRFCLFTPQYSFFFIVINKYNFIYFLKFKTVHCFLIVFCPIVKKRCFKSVNINCIALGFLFYRS